MNLDNIVAVVGRGVPSQKPDMTATDLNSTHKFHGELAKRLTNY